MQLLKHLNANGVQLKLFPFLRESSMSSYLFDNPDVLSLDKENLSDVEVVCTEMPVVNGGQVKGKNGRIDFAVSYSPEIFGVVELKLGRLDSKSLVQLKAYLAQIEQIEEKILTRDDLEVAKKPKWIGVLVGESIKDDLLGELKEIEYKFENIDLVALTVKRFKSNCNQIYIVTDTYCSEKISLKDKTQYRFQNQTYGKGRLVLAVVKAYCQKYPNATYNDLEYKFDSKWISTVDKAREIEEKDRKRHFLNEEDIIQLKNKTRIAVSSQWGSKNIERFLTKANIIYRNGIKKL